MKIKEYKNKLVLSELDWDNDYLLLVDPGRLKIEMLSACLKELRSRGHRICVLAVTDVEKAVRFVEVKKPL